MGAVNTCIYCLKKKKKSEFNVEHVIPESFGTFGTNTYTLHGQEVCRECNSYFGDKFELILGRGTIEGDLRFQLGLKKAKEYQSIGKKSKTIMQVPDGVWKGIWATKYYSSEYNGLLSVPLPQVCFFKKDSDVPECFLLKDIPNKEELENKGYDLNKPGSIRIPVNDLTEIIPILKEKGINLKIEGEIGETTGYYKKAFDVIENIDNLKFRIMAKIAFNYFTYHENKSFILQKDFDTIRNFIRYGNKPNYQIVILSKERIHLLPSLGKGTPIGHRITVNWAIDQSSIVATVSLFNISSYVISIAINCQDKSRQIKRGHFFDPFGEQIIELSTI